MLQFKYPKTDKKLRTFFSLKGSDEFISAPREFFSGVRHKTKKNTFHVRGCYGHDKVDI